MRLYTLESDAFLQNYAGEHLLLEKTDIHVEVQDYAKKLAAVYHKRCTNGRAFEESYMALDFPVSNPMDQLHFAESSAFVAKHYNAFSGVFVIGLDSLLAKGETKDWDALSRILQGIRGQGDVRFIFLAQSAEELSLKLSDLFHMLGIVVNRVVVDYPDAEHYAECLLKNTRIKKGYNKLLRDEVSALQESGEFHGELTVRALEGLLNAVEDLNDDSITACFRSLTQRDTVRTNTNRTIGFRMHG